MVPKPSSEEQLEHKDYIISVRWTPLTVTIFAISLAIPYLGLVFLVATKLSWGAAIGLIVLPILIGAIIAAFYAIANNNF